MFVSESEAEIIFPSDDFSSLLLACIAPRRESPERIPLLTRREKVGVCTRESGVLVPSASRELTTRRRRTVDAIRVSFRVSFAGSLRVATTSRYKWRRLCQFPLFRFSSPFAAGVSFYAVLRVLLSFLFANDICYLDCFLQTIDFGKICVTCFITCSTDLYPRDYNA